MDGSHPASALKSKTCLLARSPILRLGLNQCESEFFHIKISFIHNQLVLRPGDKRDRSVVVTRLWLCHLRRRIVTTRWTRPVPPLPRQQQQQRAPASTSALGKAAIAPMATRNASNVTKGSIQERFAMPVRSVVTNDMLEAISCRGTWRVRMDGRRRDEEDLQRRLV